MNGGSAMAWREGKTYDVESTLFEDVQALKYFGDLCLAWLGVEVHMFYSAEKSQLSENPAYKEGDLIGLRDEDIISAVEGQGRSGGFPY
jgi:hypothetical protein